MSNKIIASGDGWAAYVDNNRYTFTIKSKNGVWYGTNVRKEIIDALPHRDLVVVAGSKEINMLVGDVLKLTLSDGRLLELTYDEFMRMKQADWKLLKELETIAKALKDAEQAVEARDLTIKRLDTLLKEKECKSPGFEPGQTVWSKASGKKCIIAKIEDEETMIVHPGEIKVHTSLFTDKKAPTFWESHWRKIAVVAGLISGSAVLLQGILVCMRM